MQFCWKLAWDRTAQARRGGAREAGTRIISASERSSRSLQSEWNWTSEIAEQQRIFRTRSTSSSSMGRGPNYAPQPVYHSGGAIKEDFHGLSQSRGSNFLSFCDDHVVQMNIFAEREAQMESFVECLCEFVQVEMQELCVSVSWKFLESCSLAEAILVPASLAPPRLV